MRKLVLLPLITLVTLLAAGVAEAKTSRFGLFVGANTGGLFDEELFYAEKDALKMAEIFATVGSIPSLRSTVLTGPTPSSLMSAFDSLEALVMLTKEYGDRAEVIVYYSGHADGTGLELGEDVVPWSVFKGRVEDLDADLAVVIMDACQSGGLIQVKGATFVPGGFSMALVDNEATSGQILITSAAPDEYAQESDRFSGGIFSHFFASGLLGQADEDGDSKVTVYEAYGYAYDKTVGETAGSAAGVQHPRFEYDVKGQKDIVLTHLMDGAIPLAIDEGLEGQFFVYSEELDLVLAEVTKVAGTPLVIPVKPGTYKVKWVNGAGASMAGVSLKTGGATVAQGPLAKADFEPLEPWNDPVKGTTSRVHLHTLMGGAHTWFAGGGEVSGLPVVPGTAWGADLQVLAQNVPLKPLFMRFGFGAWSGDGVYESEELDVSVSSTGLQVSVGLGMAYPLHHKVMIAGGLEAGLVHLSRSFTAPGLVMDQSGFAPSIGAFAMTTVRIWKRVAAMAAVDATYLPVWEVDGPVHLGSVSLLFGVSIMLD